MVLRKEELMKVTINYKGAQALRGSISFETDKVFYKTAYGIKEIGYLPEGSKRKTWHPIAGKLDETNDYSDTEVIIEDREA